MITGFKQQEFMISHRRLLRIKVVTSQKVREFIYIFLYFNSILNSSNLKVEN